MKILLFITLLGLPFLDVSRVNVVQAETLQQANVYHAICDASAAVALGKSLFVVANDEDQVLHFYRRDGVQKEAVQSYDLSPFLHLDDQHPEADIEAATRIGDRIYWITSHGASKKGKYRSSRHKFFATRIVEHEDKLDVQFIGQVYESLLDDMVASPQLRGFALDAAAAYPAKQFGGLNIEGLAARPDGTLWIAFRNPVPAGKALMIALLNPDAVIDGKVARFGEALLLPLQGLAIRGLEYSPVLGQYIMIAGAYSQGQFLLYRWTGFAADKPELINTINLRGLYPESVVVYPDGGIQLISDDGSRQLAGKKCKHLPPEKRKFRSVELLR